MRLIICLGLFWGGNSQIEPIHGAAFFTYGETKWARFSSQTLTRSLPMRNARHGTPLLDCRGVVAHRLDRGFSKSSDTHGPANPRTNGQQRPP